MLQLHTHGTLNSYITVIVHGMLIQFCVILCLNSPQSLPQNYFTTIIINFVIIIISIKKEELPPSPPSSPPPPYTEFDTNRRFVSLFQQPPDGHQHQHGYNPAMHRTRSQGYVTSRSRVQRYPSPSTPQGERSGEGSSYPSSNEGTLV